MAVFIDITRTDNNMHSVDIEEKASQKLEQIKTKGTCLFMFSKDDLATVYVPAVEVCVCVLLTVYTATRITAKKWAD